MLNTGVDDVVNLVDLDFDIVYNLTDLGLGLNLKIVWIFLAN